MPDIDFAITGVEVERHAVAPLLRFALCVSSRSPDCAVLNIMLGTQICIEPTRRRYAAPEQERLSDLFGEPERWGKSLHSFLWTHSSLLVPAFDRECTIDLPVACSYDFNIAATKYFHGVEDGDIPLSFLFSGSIFYRDPDGELQIAQIPWSRESAFRLPVAVWRRMMDDYYPQSTWLCLGRDAFEQLYRYKREKGLPSFEHALNDLIAPRLTSAVS